MTETSAPYSIWFQSIRARGYLDSASSRARHLVPSLLQTEPCGCTEAQVLPVELPEHSAKGQDSVMLQVWRAAWRSEPSAPSSKSSMFVWML